MEITIPTSLKDITLGQYQRMIKLQETETDENILKARLIEVFCNVDLKDAFRMNMNDTDSIVESIIEVVQMESTFIPRTTIKGVAYGFIPDLDEMTLGEYVDLDGTFTDWQRMHQAMNVLYRPIVNSINDKYNIKKYDGKNPSKMKDMTLDVVYGAMVFFYHLGKELSSHTLLYSTENQIPKNIQKHLTLLRNGDGINQFMPWQKEE